MQAGLRELLEKRRNRSIAIILGVKEREVDPLLRKADPSGSVGTKMRKVVLDQVNEFHDLVLDLLDSLDNGEVLLNEQYLDRLDAVHTDIAVIRRIVETNSA